jgi:hypothetical protein
MLVAVLVYRSLWFLAYYYILCQANSDSDSPCLCSCDQMYGLSSMWGTSLRDAPERFGTKSRAVSAEGYLRNGEV